MKRGYFVFFSVALCLALNTFSISNAGNNQTIESPSDTHKFLCSQLFHLQWGQGNDQVGLFKGPGQNFGPQSLAVDEQDQRIYILDSKNSRVLVLSLNGEFIEKVGISGKPDDMCLQDDGSIKLLYVSDKKVLSLDRAHKEAMTFDIPDLAYQPIGITCYDISGFSLRTSNSTSVSFSKEPDATKYEISKERGIQSDGFLISIEKTSPSLGSLNIRNKLSDQSSNIIIHGVYGRLEVIDLIGIDGNSNIYLNVEEASDDGHIKRFLRKYNARGSLLAASTLPYSNYAHTFRDLRVARSGNVYQVLPLKDGVKLLFWNLGPIDKGTAYTPDEFPPYSEIPLNLYAQKSEFEEDHEGIEDLALEEGIDSFAVPLSISRNEIMQRAESYRSHWFNVGSGNLVPSGVTCYQSGKSKTVKTYGSWLTGPGSYMSVPYKWGGFSGLQGVTEYTDCGYFFDEGLTTGKYSGDINCVGGIGYCCAVGVDCSGFVSQAWGLSSKRSTRSLVSISTRLGSKDDLSPGDMLDRVGSHVMLFSNRESDGRYTVIEASSWDWRVSKRSYTASGISDYQPYRYNGLGITVSGFTSQVESKGVSLKWSLPNYETCIALNIFRKTGDDSDYTKINSEILLPRQGTLSYNDYTTNHDTRYIYKVETVDAEGRRTMHGPFSVGS